MVGAFDAVTKLSTGQTQGSCYRNFKNNYLNKTLLPTGGADKAMPLMPLSAQIAVGTALGAAAMGCGSGTTPVLALSLYEK